MSYSIIHDRTPVCAIANTLNRRCVASAEAGDFVEAKRIATLVGEVEDAIREAAVDSSHYVDRTQELRVALIFAASWIETGKPLDGLAHSMRESAA